MKGKRKESELDDEMRPEYDFSKVTFVGRGIYAERFRAGTKFFLLDDNQDVKEHGPKEDNLNEPWNIPNSR